MKDRKRIAFGILGVAALAAVILYMGGFLATGLIGPSDEIGEKEIPYRPAQTAQAILRTIPTWYEAVGTVRARTNTKIEAQVTARIRAINVRAGDRVEPDSLLIVLDDDRLQSRIAQAKEGLGLAQAGKAQAEQVIKGARAAYEEAESQYKRILTYFEKEAATQRDLERAVSAHHQAEARLGKARDGLDLANARVRQAQEKVEESRIALNYTRVLAPEGGQVVERLADPGDLAMPGKPLLTLQSEGSLRLEAQVGEEVIGKIRTGDRFHVVIDSLDRTLECEIEEVVPSADPRSRTILVKAALPSTSGIYPGMFGRLRVPVGERSVVLVPEEAVREIGQLEMVKAKVRDTWKELAVTTGERFDGHVEILSGLSGGETVEVGEGRHG